MPEAIAAAPPPPVVTGSGANKRVTLNRAELANDVMMVRSGRMTLEGDHFEYDVAAGKIIKSGPVRITVLPSSPSTPSPSTPAPKP